ncbi:MAG: hypothetical protein KGH95_05960, partial [Thaumarchaeota archaeon]|nr:hypothetical protein [Nitrososphaerota archaeon]
MVPKGNRIDVLAKVISIFSIIMISTSILGIAYAQSDVMPFTSSQKYPVPIPDTTSSISPNPHVSKTVTINLAENMGVTTNSGSQQPKSNVSPKISTVYNISLSENLGIYTNNYNQNFVSIIQQNFEKTTMDKISNSDRIRISGKKIIIENSISLEKSFDYNPTIINVISMTQQNINKNNILYEFENWSDNTNLISLFEYTSEDFHLEINSMEHGIMPTVHSLADPKNPTLLILLIPLSGFLLMDIKEAKLRYNSKRIFSFCFIVILVASSVVTPMSISSNYWGAAYAQPSNSTTGLSANTNSTHSIIPVFTTSNSTQPLPNISQRNSTHSIIPVFTTSNSTQPLPNISQRNSTHSLPNIPPSNFQPLPNVPPHNSTHSVTPVFTTSNSTQPLPNTSPSNSTLSANLWNLGASVNNTKSVGKLQVQNDTNGKLLQLKGNGFLTSNVTSTTNLSALTLSAWVKPDYSQGSGTFTVISKENQFALAVNNNIPPVKKATFSVYDGIKWSTVNSTSTLGEDWTHLVATYNGSSISLYVNGTLQSSLHIAGIPTLAVNGKLVTTDVSHISSNADIVIGAYFNSLSRNPNNLFSGSIQGVNLYNSTFTSSQINSLYLKDVLSYAPVTQIPLNSIGLNTTNSTNNTSTLNQISNSTLLNSTSISNSTGINDTIPIVPSVISSKKSYLLTENPDFQFEYYTKQDLNKFHKKIQETAGPVQQDKWKENNSVISAEITGPNGHSIPIKVNFEKLREGKFDIKLSSMMYGFPGLYKLKITLVKQGKTYTTESQFAWGLVALNTDRSIYKPGEIANFTITTLLNNGTSACDSNIVMKITDPNSKNTILSTGNGISMSLFDCAIYQAQYIPSIEGNYTVDVTAKTSSGVSNFSTYFLVEKNYNYEIIRMAATKIDPFDQPNNFNVKLKVHSYVSSGQITIKEFVPNVLNVTTDGSVSQVGDTKMITWVRNLDSNNDTMVSYNYAVPLIQPQLYALGQAQVSQDNVSTFTEARNWFVAVDATKTVTLHSTGIENDANIASGTNVVQFCGGSGSCTMTTWTKSQLAAGSVTAAGNNWVFNYNWLTPISTTATYTRIFSSTTGCGQTTNPSAANFAPSPNTCTQTAVYAYSLPLSDNLGISETFSAARPAATQSQSLSDSMSITDSSSPARVGTTKSVSPSPSDNLAISE